VVPTAVNNLGTVALGACRCDCCAGSYRSRVACSSVVGAIHAGRQWVEVRLDQLDTPHVGSVRATAQAGRGGGTGDLCSTEPKRARCGAGVAPPCAPSTLATQHAVCVPGRARVVCAAGSSQAGRQQAGRERRSEAAGRVPFSFSSQLGLCRVWTPPNAWLLAWRMAWQPAQQQLIEFIT
jgi:hypothetical protein